MAIEVYSYTPDARVLTPYYCGGVMYVSLVMDLFEPTEVGLKGLKAVGSLGLSVWNEKLEANLALKEEIQGLEQLDKNVTVKLLGALHKFDGSDFRGFLNDVKPTLLSALDVEYEKNNTGTTASKRFVKTSVSNLPKGFMRLESTEAINKILEEASKRIQPTGTVFTTQVIGIITHISWTAAKFPMKCDVLSITGTNEQVVDIKTRSSAMKWPTAFYESFGPKFDIKKLRVGSIKGIPFVIFNDKKSSMGCYRRMIRKELDECSFTVKEAKSRESDSVGGRGGLSFKSPLLEEMRQDKKGKFSFLRRQITCWGVTKVAVLCVQRKKVKWTERYTIADALLDITLPIFSGHAIPKTYAGMVFAIAICSGAGSYPAKMVTNIVACSAGNSQETPTKNVTVKLLGALHKFVDSDFRRFLNDVKPTLINGS
ncbi:hypothetical protein ISN44_As13g009470 [Arabidopsis suecica]|uniref:Uncharacterized protein n=1 Tax=Arabidopsis suecica TaxID=45249 RepID=A0A8T1XQM4_ARASU|nr:hypothetical protein ISN44_As13g009470 [Arabidopsis suecica]